MEENKKNKPKKNTKSTIIDFDVNSIPDYIQYDIVPLPSKGECYPHKKSRIPVKYLTTSEENIYTSPNMYNSGQLIDVILKRCILDKDIDVDELCFGDRDAIVLWLRATSYGNIYPISVKNPNNEKNNIEVNLDLTKFKVKDFDLKGDENGWFEYIMDNGTIIKYKYFNKKMLEETNDIIEKSNNSYNILNIGMNINKLKQNVLSLYYNGFENNDTLNDAVDYIEEWCQKQDTKDEEKNDKQDLKSITERMVCYTMSINGNTDREYVRNFIENMRVGESKKYRDYINKHTPGLDLTYEIQIPESDGGGSFVNSFRYDESIFITI